MVYATQQAGGGGANPLVRQTATRPYLVPWRMHALTRAHAGVPCVSCHSGGMIGHAPHECTFAIPSMSGSMTTSTKVFEAVTVMLPRAQLGTTVDWEAGHAGELPMCQPCDL